MLWAHTDTMRDAIHDAAALQIHLGGVWGMGKDEYFKKSYFMSAGQSPDVLCVTKSQGTEWCNVTLTIHAEVAADVTIRSKEMAEQLHFMLGQLLGK